MLRVLVLFLYCIIGLCTGFQYHNRAKYNQAVIDRGVPVEKWVIDDSRDIMPGFGFRCLSSEKDI